MQLTRVKVPVIVASSIICFAAGAGATFLIMMSIGYTLNEHQGDDTPPVVMRMGGQGGPMGGPGGPMGGPGGGGGRGGPTAKSQLATLVTKLDQLTRKPLTVSLSEEQRTKLRERLRGLEEKEVLAEEDAKKRLDAILEIVQSDRENLETAGYRWPGQPRAGGGGGGPPRAGGGGGGGGPPRAGGGGGAPPERPNPFKDEQNGKHLKSLDQQLASTKNS